MTRFIPRILSIAGTDPSGGAGIQADLKSIAAQGGYGMCAITALVAQNTRGVRSVHTPPVSFLREQLDAVSEDVAIDAVKIGMLASAEIIAEVSDWLAANPVPHVVLDPVMIATSGDRLLDPAAESALRELLGRVDLVTPNLPELAILAGEPAVDNWTDLLAQAERVSERYGVTVLAKGGHLSGPESPDALVDAAGGLDSENPRLSILSGPRVDTRHTHGTGCSLSAAMAALAPQTEGWVAALARAKPWLTESIRRAGQLEVGGGNGPINHLSGLWARGGFTVEESPEDLAARWWELTLPIRDGIDNLDFIRGLGDGTLDREAFLWYLAQDALYLRDYSRVLAQASALAPTGEEQVFWAQGAAGAIAAEMDLHRSHLADGEEFNARPAPATTAYVGHLLATAQLGDYDALIAAILPCYWLYQDVGTRLHPQSHAAHPFASWLDTYADDSFEQATRRAIEIVSTRAARTDEAGRARMWEAYWLSSAHELAFFAAPLRVDREDLPMLSAGGTPVLAAI